MKARLIIYFRSIISPHFLPRQGKKSPRSCAEKGSAGFSLLQASRDSEKEDTGKPGNEKEDNMIPVCKECNLKKIVSFLGSPRRNGNTEALLNAALDAGRNVGAEILPVFRLSEMKISPCRECGGCDDTGICVIEDDFREIYQALAGENLFIMASPVFFMGTTGWVKAMIDRAQCCWIGKYKLKKPIAQASPERKGIFLSVSGMKNPDVFDCAVKEVKAFFAVNNIAFAGKVLIPGMDEKGEISRNPEGLEMAAVVSRILVNPEADGGKL